MFLSRQSENYLNSKGKVEIIFELFSFIAIEALLIHL